MAQAGRIGMAGAGLSCAVIARELAEAGYRVELFERRDHLAGNCHTARDAATGVMVHVYGPHIFHTDDDEVWTYVHRFAEFKRYVNRVKARTAGAVFSLPINLHTINQFFGKAMSPAEARKFIAEQAGSSQAEPKNFEEQALHLVGPKLYEAFFKAYTEKQWGVPAITLPASLLKRLPLRFDYNDNYFEHPYQGIPAEGYTEMVRRMLDHPRITVHLQAEFSRSDVQNFEHVFFSGTLDEFFGHDEGRLGYRTLDFERLEAAGDFQGCAVMNYCEATVPFTRITEHKHFAPWETHAKTVCYREYSRPCGEADAPYYPIHQVGANPLLAAYQSRALAEKKVTFVGRLGTYRYLNMDEAIRHALDASRAWLKQHE